MKSEKGQIAEFEVEMSARYSEMEPAEAEVELNMRHIGELIQKIMMDLELKKE